MLCELMMRAIATGAVQPPAPSTCDGVKEVSSLTEDFITAVKSWITKYLNTPGAETIMRNIAYNWARYNNNNNNNNNNYNNVISFLPPI